MADGTVAPPPCPITGARDARRIGSWSAVEIARLWRQDIGIDVGGLLDGPDVISLWHADKSDLQFFHPIVTADAGLYDALRTRPWYVQADRWEFHEAASYIAATDTVLDLGAGTEPFRQFIGPARYHAMDPHAGEGGGEDPGRRVDAVCAFQVLEHAADPLAFIADAKARLRPGGLLFVSVPNRDSYVGQLRDFALDMPPHHVTRWSRQALGTLAQAVDLQVDGITASPLEPWEASLYWMSRLERLLPRPATGRSRWARVAAYFVARSMLAVMPSPPAAAGGTLLMRALA